MKKPTIYVAGPMRGHAHFNFPAFDKAEAQLRAEGWHVISPAQIDRLMEGYDPYPPEGQVFTQADYRRMMLRDLTAIAESCDAIYLLPGWENSKGAQVEKAFANFLGLEILTHDGLGKLRLIGISCANRK